MSTTARARLLPVAAFVSLLVLALGATGLFSLHLTDAKASQALRQYELANGVLLEALRARADFKTQVQEWKNILLRGRDPKDFGAYRERFERQEAAVRADVAGLLQAHESMHLADPAALDVRAIADEHRRLGEAYRAALATFAPADPESPARIDAAVRGIDRGLSDRFDALAVAMEKENAARLRSLDRDAAARYERLRRVTWIVAGLAVLASLGLVFRAARAAA